MMTVPLPSPAQTITSGPDGDLWITLLDNNAIASVNPTTDAVTLFNTPQGVYPYQITAGPDGNLWFAVYANPSVERFDPQTGVFTDFPAPTTGFSSNGVGIASGPGGNIWLTEIGDGWSTEQGEGDSGGTIAMINPATGAVTQYAVPNLLEPYSITAGPDGNMWFAAHDGYPLGTNGNIGVLTLGNDPAPDAPGPGAGSPPTIASAPPGSSTQTTAPTSPGAPFGFTLTIDDSARHADAGSASEMSLALADGIAGASLSVATNHGTATYSGLTIKKRSDGGYKVMADLGGSVRPRDRSQALAAMRRPMITEKLLMSGGGKHKHVLAAEVVISKALDPALVQELTDPSARGPREAGHGSRS
jgi:hypothetical protein